MVDELRLSTDGDRGNFEAHERRICRQGRLDHRPALLGLERTHAIEQYPTRLQHARRCCEHTPLLRDEAGDVLGALEIGQVRMAANGAGGRARRIEQYGIGEGRRLPGDRIGFEDVGL